MGNKDWSRTEDLGVMFDRLDIELLEVAANLCQVAAIRRALADSDTALILVGQAADLLTERARVWSDGCFAQSLQ